MSDQNLAQKIAPLTASIVLLRSVLLLPPAHVTVASASWIKSANRRRQRDFSQALQIALPDPLKRKFPLQKNIQHSGEMHQRV